MEYQKDFPRAFNGLGSVLIDKDLLGLFLCNCYCKDTENSREGKKEEKHSTCQKIKLNLCFSLS